MNTGTVHPLASKLPTKQGNSNGNSNKLTGHNDRLWYGTITLGTPPENFTGGTSFRHWQVTVANINREAYSAV